MIPVPAYYVDLVLNGINNCTYNYPNLQGG